MAGLNVMNKLTKQTQANLAKGMPGQTKARKTPLPGSTNLPPIRSDPNEATRRMRLGATPGGIGSPTAFNLAAPLPNSMRPKTATEKASLEMQGTTAGAVNQLHQQFGQVQNNAMQQLGGAPNANHAAMQQQMQQAFQKNQQMQGTTAGAENQLHQQFGQAQSNAMQQPGGAPNANHAAMQQQMQQQMQQNPQMALNPQPQGRAASGLLPGAGAPPHPNSPQSVLTDYYGPNGTAAAAIAANPGSQYTDHQNAPGPYQGPPLIDANGQFIGAPTAGQLGNGLGIPPSVAATPGDNFTSSPHPDDPTAPPRPQQNPGADPLQNPSSSDWANPANQLPGWVPDPNNPPTGPNDPGLTGVTPPVDGQGGQGGQTTGGTSTSTTATVDPGAGPASLDTPEQGIIDPNTAATIDPVTGELQTEGTVEGRMEGILDPNNPLMQRAVRLANEQSNSRGLMNSSMGAGAAMNAMLEQAQSIATTDAAAFNTQYLANQDALNKGIFTTAEFKQSMIDLNQRFAQEHALKRSDAADAKDLLETGHVNNMEQMNRDGEIREGLLMKELDNRIALGELDSSTKIQIQEMGDATRVFIQGNASGAAIWIQGMQGLIEVMNRDDVTPEDRLAAGNSVLTTIYEGLLTTHILAGGTEEDFDIEPFEPFTLSPGGNLPGPGV